MDAYLLLARAFTVLALLLSAYLVACGVNALVEWIVKNLRP